MALVQAPAMSLEASGSIGNAITFSRWKGRAYVRSKVTPHNPRSATQTGVRSAFKFLSQRWAALGAVIWATWDTLAAATNISPFNAYISNNQARWRMGLGLSQEYPAAEAHAPAAITAVVAAGAERHAQLTITATPGANDWGYVICRSLLTGFTPSWATVVEILPATLNPVWIDSPLVPDTYYYRVARIGDDGLIGAYYAEQSATVT